MNNQTGKSYGGGSAVSVPVDPTAHSVDFLQRLGERVARLSAIRVGIKEFESAVVGVEPSPPSKENLQEVRPDTVVGNQNRLLDDLAEEITAIESSLRHLRSFA